MPARLDHLVIAVPDLEAAAGRWTEAGLPAVRGGAHPVGTVNALVRGPEPSYVELIAAGSEESNPSLDRVRSVHGPISWAIAVDDVDAARADLVTAGFDPQPVREGSRTTPDGDVVAWRMCDVGPGPYDGGLPFLIEWTTPMPPGPADGPVVTHVQLAPPDPERVADLLLALGFAGNEHWPRRLFHEPGRVHGRITLLPVGEPVLREGSLRVSWGEDKGTPLTTVTMSVPRESPDAAVLDGVQVQVVPDRRRFPADALRPGVDAAFARLRGDLGDWPHPHPGEPPREEEYSRCDDPGRYRLLGVRADAWIEAITSAGLGTAEEVPPEEVAWLAEAGLPPTRTTVLRGTRTGTQPVVVGWAPMHDVPDTLVLVGVGEPTEVLERQPDCGCDACDTGSVDLLDTLDSAFVLALTGGGLRGEPWL